MGRYDPCRTLDMFREGGLLFCTAHFVQDYCSIEELTFAFDYLHKGVRRRAAG